MRRKLGGQLNQYQMDCIRLIEACDVFELEANKLQSEHKDKKSEPNTELTTRISDLREKIKAVRGSISG